MLINMLIMSYTTCDKSIHSLQGCMQFQGPNKIDPLFMDHEFLKYFHEICHIGKF